MQLRCETANLSRIRTPATSHSNCVNDAMRFDQLDQHVKVGERLGQAIDLVDDHHIDLALANGGKRGVNPGRSRDPSDKLTIVIAGPNQLPALVGLVLDIGKRLRSYGSSTHIGVTVGLDGATSSSYR